MFGYAYCGTSLVDYLEDNYNHGRANYYDQVYYDK